MKQKELEQFMMEQLPETFNKSEGSGNLIFIGALASGIIKAREMYLEEISLQTAEAILEPCPCRMMETDRKDEKNELANVSFSNIARLCHEVNRAYCRSIGDDSQPAWEDAPQWQRISAINGVNFHFMNETTPEQSHENWLKEKEADGWVYGPVKDPDRKEHPCMVPYYELPIEQRTKDYLFKAIVDTFKL